MPLHWWYDNSENISKKKTQKHTQETTTKKHKQTKNKTNTELPHNSLLNYP